MPSKPWTNILHNQSLSHCFYRETGMGPTEDYSTRWLGCELILWVSEGHSAPWEETCGVSRRAKHQGWK